MAKSPMEKQIEKQMKQAKQLADRQRRDEQKQAREKARIERKAMIRDRASSIVNGQPIIEGIRIMDKTAEEVLECLLECEQQNGGRVCFSDDIFPTYTQMSLDVELEKLTQYGMVGGLLSFNNGGILNLLPPAFSYFENKARAQNAYDKKEEERKMQSIVNYGNLVFGDVTESTLSVDNSIHEIERAIDERGGDDKEMLYDILNEVKELIDNMKTSRMIPKQKKLYQKISDHMEKHSWFYSAIVQLIGTAVMNVLGA